jgi:hypothetical protein
LTIISRVFSLCSIVVHPFRPRLVCRVVVVSFRQLSPLPGVLFKGKAQYLYCTMFCAACKAENRPALGNRPVFALIYGISFLH